RRYPHRVRRADIAAREEPGERADAEPADRHERLGGEVEEVRRGRADRETGFPGLAVRRQRGLPVQGEDEREYHGQDRQPRHDSLLSRGVPRERRRGKTRITPAPRPSPLRRSSSATARQPGSAASACAYTAKSAAEKR